MQEHYICTGGCGGSLESAGVCQTEGCANKEKSMEECSCADGYHKQGTQQDPEETEGGGDM
jgi:hypothetical protein